MSDLGKISKAIEFHEYWKVRLFQAIESGVSLWQPEYVQDDSRCEFGQWLYSFSISDQASEQWKKIQAVHAEFHRAAANIVRLAIDAHKAEALAMLNNIAGEYRQTSMRLLRYLNDWEDTVLATTFRDKMNGRSNFSILRYLR
jgi:hypothetical protein